MWGVHLTFRASGSKEEKFLQDIEKIVLTIGPESGPSESLSEQPVKYYIFVPGTIEW